MALTRIYDAFSLLTQPHSAAVIRRAVSCRLGSETIAYGLRRDLAVAHAAPAAKIPLVVRPLQSSDDLSILDTAAPDLSRQAVSGRLSQRRLIAAKLPTCWVAIGPDGKVCYMQWLIAPKDNARIRALWGDLFPQLSSGEALLEGAYTGDAYRGQGIMAHAMSRIAEQAGEFGACWVQTFVGQSNVASLKGCKRAGFVPFQRRKEVWRLLRRTVEFAHVPEGTPYPFDLESPSGRRNTHAKQGEAESQARVAHEVQARRPSDWEARVPINRSTDPRTDGMAGADARPHAGTDLGSRPRDD